MSTLHNVDILDAILQSVVATRLWDVEENWFFGLIIKIGGVCAAQMNEWDSHSSKLKLREKLQKKNYISRIIEKFNISKIKTH